MPRLTPSILISLVFHAGLLALALFFLSRQEPVPEIRIGSVPVTIVSEIERRAAPTPAPAEEIFDEVTPDASDVSEADTPEPPAPQPAATPTPPTSQRQPPTPPRRPAQQPTQRPPQTPPRQPPSPPQRQPEPLILGTLYGDGAPPRRNPGRPATESGAGDAPVATGQQVALFGRQVIPHWNLTFCEMSGGDNLTVRMRLTVDSRGRITEGPTLINPQSGSVWRAASESALRAVRAAAPYDVPDGYQSSSVTFRFETADACP